MSTILSIQSSVAYGHVGNSAATFPLMRMGVEVWPVFTVHFSNHTGYGSWRGPLLSAADVAAVISGIDERGVLGQVDAVLSGYQGSEDMAEVIIDAVSLVQRRNPAAFYCCDPVLGDVGLGIYVRPGIPAVMRDRVIPRARIVTPNQFELGELTGFPTTTLAQVLIAVDYLRRRGPEIVLVTSVVDSAAEPGTPDPTTLDSRNPEPKTSETKTLDMVAVSATGAWSVRTPLLRQTFTGAGDLTSATFLARILAGSSVAEALGETASIVYGVLDMTVGSGRTELALVEAQHEMVQPSRTFAVRTL